MVESDLPTSTGLLGFERELLLPHVRAFMDDLFGDEVEHAVRDREEAGADAVSGG